MAEEILSIKQLAELLQLSERTVYRLANGGEIPGLKVGGSWRFPRSRVEEWLDQQLEQTKNKQAGARKRKAKRRHQPPGGRST